jgi:hypothetical protein
LISDEEIEVAGTREVVGIFTVEAVEYLNVVGVGVSEIENLPFK